MRCRIGSVCRTARRSISTTAETCRFSPLCGEGQAVGFAALKATSPCAGEIYVMGVLPEYHRSGIGQQLFAAISGGGNRARLSAAAGQNRADGALRGV
ncbi:MAG: GNAT family N-acetyltransferase [Christensenellales bacterium]